MSYVIKMINFRVLGAILRGMCAIAHLWKELAKLSRKWLLCWKYLDLIFWERLF